MTLTHGRQLIVNADDLGRTPGINSGIFEAHARGIVTSATLMVGFEAAQEAASQLTRFPQLGIGLHVTLTGARPLLPPALLPSLVDQDGRFLVQARRSWDTRSARAEGGNRSSTYPVRGAHRTETDPSRQPPPLAPDTGDLWGADRLRTRPGNSDPSTRDMELGHACERQVSRQPTPSSRRSSDRRRRSPSCGGFSVTSAPARPRSCVTRR